MILDLRILEAANGRQILQMYETEIAGIDESGCVHTTGRGRWKDVPVHSFAQWDWKDGERVVIEQKQEGQA